MIIILGMLGGCSSSPDYQAGLYTKSVAGTIRPSAAHEEARCFVLVLNYHRTLIETSEGYLSRVTASLVYPDQEGNYKATFDADTVTLELAFYAKGHLVLNQQFHRSLGIGAYNFNVKLKEDVDWKNSYYLMIKPSLSDYITEGRYLMNQFDKHYIGEWLAGIDEEL